MLSQPEFDLRGRVYLRDHERKEIILSRNVWDHVLARDDRYFIKFNYDKIVQTVAAPDEIRRSSKKQDSKLAYKAFATIYVRPGIEVPNPIKYFVVVITKDQFIQTVYTTPTIKEGERLWPNP